MVITTRKTTKIIAILVVSLVFNKVTRYNYESNIINDNINKTLEIAVMSSKIEEIKRNDIYSVIDTYKGDLTGYGANCPLCGGHLGCNGMDVRDGTTTYNDEVYGEVNIVASSKKIKCGSIVQFELNNKKVMAIVLDRGVTGYDLDLLVESEKYASKYIGRKKIKYDLIRSGWNKE